MITPTGDRLLDKLRKQGWDDIQLIYKLDMPRDHRFYLLVENDSSPPYDLAEAWGSTALQAIRKVVKILQEVEEK